ncbi:DUF4251 domain-containing protein [Cellulophaga baltica]|uniref:DUF4251 domain-containing protein n=1 Tax=Cellulophaga baltica TaxID=76594 RepID=UPI0024940A40|nr:DUF4251 domain-containing protein [Cellulophaga baltica]
MILRFLVILCAFFSGIACSNSKKMVSATPKSIALDQLVVQKNFQISSDWATPMATSSMNYIANNGLLGPGNSPGNINLIGNTNYLSFKGDSITAHLPYFGERQMGGGYAVSDTGITFNTVPTSYEQVKNDRTQTHTIKFKISGDSNEHYSITVLLFPNWTSEIMVTSSQRTSIGFRGTVSEIAPLEN